MFKPQTMTYLDISIHKSQIPAFLNIIPEHHIHIVEFTEMEEKKVHHIRREHRMQEDLEIIEHKIHTIEENLHFYFTSLDIDPDEIKPFKKEDKINMEIHSVDEALDVLVDRTDNGTRDLKQQLTIIKNQSSELENTRRLISILTFLEKYNPSSDVFDWFNQLEFRLFYCKTEDFVDIEISFENEDMPLILEFSPLENDETVFFIIHHKAHHEFVNTVCQSATEIEEYRIYFNEDGVEKSVLEEDIDFAKFKLKKASSQVEEYRKRKLEFRGYVEILENCKRFLKLERQFRESYRKNVVRLRAFVPTKQKKEILALLEEKFSKQIRIIVRSMIRNSDKKIKYDNNIEALGTDDEEYLYSEEWEEKSNLVVPSMVKLPRLIRPFRLLTNLYGTTNYNEIDPTPIVAITYPILFGLMFGDLGHGFTLIGIGLLIAIFSLFKKKSQMVDAGILLIWLGFGASIAGVIYGEFFGTTFIEPIASPLHDVKTVLKIGIYTGVVHLTLGWILAMANNIQNGKAYFAFTDHLMKIFILWGGTYIIFGIGFDFKEWVSPNTTIPYSIILILIPTLILIIGKPFGKLFKIKSLDHESFSELLGEQVVDTGETFLSILSNVASYTRILALAMAHMGLMLMVTVLNETFGGDNIILTILIFVIGNLFVIIIEAVIVAIHALRLTFYEFFGKFYLGDGVPYEITKIEKKYSLLNFISE